MDERDHQDMNETPIRQSNRSQNIGELAKALAAAQGQMEAARKDTKNPFYGKSYSTLAACWDAVRDQLANNGLAVSQLPFEDGDRIGVETILMHSSDQWVSSSLSMTPVREKKGEGFIAAYDPQAAGSTITYLRRYSLAAIVGIAQEDDDGNAGSGKNDKKPEGSTKPPSKSATKEPAKQAPPPRTDFHSMTPEKKAQFIVSRIAEAVAITDPQEGLKKLADIAGRPGLKELDEMGLARVRQALQDGENVFNELLAQESQQ